MFYNLKKSAERNCNDGGRIEYFEQGKDETGSFRIA
jgi:hypothetical protein